MRTESKIAAAFALTFAVVVLIGILAYANTQALLRQNQAVTHTYDVLAQLDAMLNVAQDAETGMRGYVIGKREDLLAPYKTALAEFPGRADALRRLVNDNPVQLANAEHLTELIRLRLESARGRVELRQRQTLEEMMAVMTNGAGQQAMDAVRAQIEKMRGLESDLLARRTERFEQSGRNLYTAFGLMVFLATLLIAVFFVLVRNDFQERRRAAALVEANERRFRSLLESAPDAMILADHAGSITLVNSAFERLFGYGRQDAVGRPLRDFLAERGSGTTTSATVVPGTGVRGQDLTGAPGSDDSVPEDESALPKRLPSPRELGRLQTALPAGRSEGIRKDGSRFPADLTFNPLDLATAGGTTSGAGSSEPSIQQSITAVRDRTGQQAAEDKLRAYSEDLARSNAELERFAYVASHDLQEPLRMVSSYTQLLSRRYKGKLDASADEFIAYAVDGATRMQTLINDLLAYSRVGTKPKEFTPVDAGAVLKKVLHDMQGTLETRAATVVHDPLPTVLADSVQLGQLFQNLIGNATKFSRPEEPPKVEITVYRRSRRFWRFSFQDNGIGIDPKYFERIFVIFQRLHTKQEYAGTGIGLAICKKIVERHGGRLWVESEPGQGAKFLFTLPASED